MHIVLCVFVCVCVNVCVCTSVCVCTCVSALAYVSQSIPKFTIIMQSLTLGILFMVCKEIATLRIVARPAGRLNIDLYIDSYFFHTFLFRASRQADREEEEAVTAQRLNFISFSFIKCTMPAF